MNAFFLNDREKHYAVQRLAENKTGITNRQWKWDQAQEAFIDPKTWVLFFFNIAINIPNGGLTTFSGIIINNLGFSPMITSLLNMPTGVMSTLSAFCFSCIAAKWSNRRCLVTILACCVPMIGAILVYSLPRTSIGGQMVGIYLVRSISRLALDTRLTTLLSYIHISVLTSSESPWLRLILRVIPKRPYSILFYL